MEEILKNRAQNPVKFPAFGLGSSGKGLLEGAYPKMTDKGELMKGSDGTAQRFK